MSKLFIPAACIAALVAVATPSPASGATVDKLAYLTFNASVQVPGATLPAGTYRFHVVDADTSADVMQVLSNNGRIAYAMFLTLPDRRMQLTDTPTVTFMETPSGVPPAVRTFFYGGEYHGYQFVYPKGGPNMIANVAPQPEITLTPNPAPIIDTPPLRYEAPPIAAAPVFELPAFEPPLEQAPVAPPAELPKTGSDLPLIVLGGLSSILGGLGVRLRRRRSA